MDRYKETDLNNAAMALVTFLNKNVNDMLPEFKQNPRNPDVAMVIEPESTKVSPGVELYPLDKAKCTRAFVQHNNYWDLNCAVGNRIREWLLSKAKLYTTTQCLQRAQAPNTFQSSQIHNEVTLVMEYMSQLGVIVNETEKLEKSRYEYGIEFKNGLHKDDRSCLNGSTGTIGLFCELKQLPKPVSVAQDQKQDQALTYMAVLHLSQQPKRSKNSSGKRRSMEVEDEDDEFSYLDDVVLDFRTSAGPITVDAQLENADLDCLVRRSQEAPRVPEVKFEDESAIITGKTEEEQQLLHDQRYVRPVVWDAETEEAQNGQPNELQPDIEMGVNSNGRTYRFRRGGRGGENTKDTK
jgi:hypothetical protein